MKYLSMILLINLFATASFSQTKPEIYTDELQYEHWVIQNKFGFFFQELQDDQDMIKKNSIKKELVYKYSFNRRKVKDSSLDYCIDYDQFGNVLANSSIWINGKPSSIDSNYYNEAHLLTRTVNITPTEYYTTVYEYDSIGKELVHIRYSKDSMFYQTTQKFYNRKNLLEYISESMGLGDFYPVMKYVYDNRGELIEDDQLKRNMTPNLVTLHEYDTLGN